MFASGFWVRKQLQTKPQRMVSLQQDMNSFNLYNLRFTTQKLTIPYIDLDTPYINLYRYAWWLVKICFIQTMAMSHTQPPHWVWRYICLILHTDYPQHQNMQQAFFDPLPAHSNTFTLIHSFIREERVTKEHSWDSFSPEFLFSWIILSSLVPLRFYALAN